MIVVRAYGVGTYTNISMAVVRRRYIKCLRAKREDLGFEGLLESYVSLDCCRTASYVRAIFYLAYETNRNNTVVINSFYVVPALRSICGVSISQQLDENIENIIKRIVNKIGYVIQLFRFKFN